MPTELKKHLRTLSGGIHRSSTDIRGQPVVAGSHDNVMVEDGGRKVRFGDV